MNTAEKCMENRLRRKARQCGLRLSKSRRRDPSALDYGLYCLIDIRTGGLDHWAGQFAHVLDLDEVEAYLND
jgi:hypothetical protein